MPTLPIDLRNKLERVIVDARDAAEAGARAALEALAVHHFEPYKHMTPAQRKLRNHLRARARQLGDRKLPRPQKGGQDHTIDHLVGECAYEHWHRMLFARFLAENGLLIEPEMGVAISLQEAEELAAEEGVDVWTFASRCAKRMLSEIFRPDDPLLAVSLATEHRVKLERLLDSLPAAVFTASDALGWVYQFWQSKKKDEVNRSEVKIGADELPAVTQLFTEPYMVNFLIHNTLGAWWAGKTLQSRDREGAESEDELRRKLALPGVNWEYLRFVRGEDGKGGPWRPAAGTFDGWPKAASGLKVLDPCCGSGHFLVAMLHHLVPIRMAEEGLSAAEAVDAVLRDNLHGLEIDERCCQIAAFALAFAAWTYPGAGGYRPLPKPHIACTGISPQCSLDEWLKLAVEAGMPRWGHEREMVERALSLLHELFSQAPTLGSLIDPRSFAAGKIAADYETIKPYLDAALAAETADYDTHERAIAAAGMVKAGELLAGEYSLVITNVPYLGRGNQHDVLKEHLEKHYKHGKADLATAFVLRCLEFCAADGSTALVTPQNWLFLTSYKKLRTALLKQRTWKMVARLGAGAFETIGGHVVNVALLAVSARRPASDALMAGIDVSSARQPDEKAALLRGLPVAPPGLPPTAGEVRPTEGLAPAQERTAPATERTVPAAERMTPAKERAAPAEERTVPAEERTVPAKERTVPAEERTVPAKERTVPAKERTTRSKERMIRSPAAEGPRKAEKAPGRPENAVSSPQDGPGDTGEALSPPTDAAAADGPADGSIKLVPQAEQLKNPDARVVTHRLNNTASRLAEYVAIHAGFSTGDIDRFLLRFWEVGEIDEPFLLHETGPERTTCYTGLSNIVIDPSNSRYEGLLGFRKRGMGAWGRCGISINKMAQLPAKLYLGMPFDAIAPVLVPKCEDHLRAIWNYISSPEFRTAVRVLDQKLSAANLSFIGVPFDLAHWQKIAAEKYPHGLPEPQSNDPTQWLFHGHPAGMMAAGPAERSPWGIADPVGADRHPSLICREPNPKDVLQVAVARLLGYRWPAELDDSMRLDEAARAWVKRCDELLEFADEDGIVCIPSVRGEDSAAERLRRLLAAAFGNAWSAQRERELIAATGSKETTLDGWLRNDFFEQHCQLFHHRPFIWHIWDARKRDGFHALVNYHKLAEGGGKGRKLLESLTYSYLGDWITRQKDAVRRGEGGAEDRLAAALELRKRLEAILEGEPPFDIFVRWKPLHQQPIGWEPDINDGVRLNIRPFLASDLPKPVCPGARKGAGILRWKPNIKWTKDRGKEPQRPKDEYPWFWSYDPANPNHALDFMGGTDFDGNRWNDLHYTNKAKQAARERSAEERAEER